MFAYAAQSNMANALIRLAVLLNAGARHLSAAAMRLAGWFERRRIASAALRDMETMSERELLDIGLSRVDLQRVAWGATRDVSGPRTIFAAPPVATFGIEARRVPARTTNGSSGRDKVEYDRSLARARAGHRRRWVAIASLPATLTVGAFIGLAAAADSGVDDSKCGAMLHGAPESVRRLEVVQTCRGVEASCGYMEPSPGYGVLTLMCPQSGVLQVVAADRLRALRIQDGGLAGDCGTGSWRRDVALPAATRLTRCQFKCAELGSQQHSIFRATARSTPRGNRRWCARRRPRPAHGSFRDRTSRTHAAHPGTRRAYSVCSPR